MQEKWALITGASSGIGEATAFALAREGYSLIVTARREERLQQLTQDLKKLHPEANYVAVPLDVTDRVQVDEFFKRESALLEKVDLLVNNAGLALGTDKMQDAKISDWDAMIDTNVRGLLSMTRGMLDYMVPRSSGHIVNIGSVAGRWTYPGGGVYCATKFAVRALSEGLRMDLLGTSIKVTNIEPGMVNTEFSLVRFGDTEKADKVYEGMEPLWAEDIAETILWCVNRPARVNIQELVIYPTDQAHVGQVYRRNS